MDVYFQGIWRMDWGLGNPNKTATLIAILMVAVWVLAYWRRWAFWVAVVLFTGLGVCLIHTFSRGGLIAASGGLAFTLWKCPRPWPRRRICGILVAVWVIGGASVYLEATKRFGQGVAQEDRSITNRLELWKAAPRMIMDAPGGWGLGNSGQAYLQWYQPLERSESYRTLVNSHLTWLVEFGWRWRILYVLGWASIFVLCWPSEKTRWTIVPFGVWVAFAIGAFFSSVAESPWLWIVPGLLAVAVLFARLRHREATVARRWPIPPLAATAVFGLIAVLAARFVGPPLHFSDGMVVLGEGAPVLRVLPTTAVFGNYPGRALREYWKSSPQNCRTIAVGGKTEPGSAGHERVLVLGGACPAVPTAARTALFAGRERILMLNPDFYPEDFGVTGADATRLKTAFGEFSGSPTAAAWEQLAVSTTRLEGVGDYVPNWPELVFSQLP